MFKLLCLTPSSEINHLSKILIDEQIEVCYIDHKPGTKATFEPGFETSLFLWDVKVEEKDLDKAEKLLSEKGIAIWIRNQ